MSAPIRIGPPSREPTRRFLVVALAVLILTGVLVLAPDALAATGNDVGGNLGGLLKRYAGEIYGGVVAIVALLFLVNRRYTELGLFLGAAMVVAWLVFSPDQVAHAARSIGQHIFGG